MIHALVARYPDDGTLKPSHRHILVISYSVVPPAAIFLRYPEVAQVRCPLTLVAGGIMGTIAARVRRARIAAGLSQANLAAAIGVRRSAVAQWENGHGTSPTPEHMAQVASKTGVQFEWLATGRGTPRTEGQPESDTEILGVAENPLESRMLEAMKCLPHAKQELAVKMVSVLADD